MALYYVWSACYRLLQFFLVWLGWRFLIFVIGVPGSFSFVGRCMVVYDFLAGHVIVAGLFFMFLFGLELLLYWLDNYVCRLILENVYMESEDQD